MSNLEELIERLCPDGVEYKTLTELFDTKNGYTPSKSKEEYWTNGTVPWFRMEDIRENGNILSKAIQYVSESAIKGSLFPADSIIVATSATIGQHALIKVPSLANQRFTYLVLKDEFKEQIDIMFIYYCCFKLDEYCKECLNQGNFASVDMKKFLKFKLPVPPLEVQREIVRILDNFTFLTAELAAELAARQKQYEYYRDLLLTFKPNESTILNERTNELEINAPVSWLKLGECCVVQSGGTPSKKNADYWLNGKIKWLSSSVCQNKKEVTNITGYITEEGLKHSSAKIMNKGTTLIALVGATIGKRAFLQYEAAINQNIAGIYPKNKNLLLPEYIYYISETLYEKFLGLTNGKLAMANLSFVRNLEIPVPQLEQQQRIVDILDCFDTLCNDISSGLPAEIEMRQKQYEYYRDKLLTFKELKKEA